MHPHVLVFLLLNCGNGAIDNELGLPTPVNVIKTTPIYMPTGKPNVENPSSGPFPWMNEDGVKVPNEANHHRYLII